MSSKSTPTSRIWPEPASPFDTRCTARIRRTSRDRPHPPRRRRYPWPPPPGCRPICARSSRERARHRRRRLHRLAPRRQPARATATTSWASTLHRLLPARGQGAATSRRARGNPRFRLVEGDLQDLRPRRRCSTASARSSTWPPSRACGRRGAATSRSTPTTTFSRPSACSRPRRRPEPRGRLRVLVVGLRRRATLPPARGRACRPVSPVRRDQAGRRAPVHASTARTTACPSSPALLHRLRPPATAGHGLPQVPEGRPGRHGPLALRRRASRPATSHTLTTSSPRSAPPPSEGAPAASTMSVEASGSR